MLRQMDNSRFQGISALAVCCLLLRPDRLRGHGDLRGNRDCTARWAGRAGD